ncbi:MAG: hypothetical protein Q9188_001149 [Gyalolechia gomerana]
MENDMIRREIERARMLDTHAEGALHPRLAAHDPARPGARYNIYYAVGQLQRRNAFYIPNLQQQSQPIDYGNVSQYRPGWERPNAAIGPPAREAQQPVAAPVHLRRAECAQGFRRVNHGNLICNVCAESMAYYVWRCMGCGEVLMETLDLTLAIA